MTNTFCLIVIVIHKEHLRSQIKYLIFHFYRFKTTMIVLLNCNSYKHYTASLAASYTFSGTELNFAGCKVF